MAKKKKSEPFIHPCHTCGSIYAPHGYGVYLLRGIVGRWFCTAHMPKEARDAQEERRVDQKRDAALARCNALGGVVVVTKDEFGTHYTAMNGAKIASADDTIARMIRDGLFVPRDAGLLDKDPQTYVPRQ